MYVKNYDLLTEEDYLRKIVSAILYSGVQDSKIRLSQKDLAELLVFVKSDTCELYCDICNIPYSKYRKYIKEHLERRYNDIDL